VDWIGGYAPHALRTGNLFILCIEWVSRHTFLGLVDRTRFARYGLDQHRIATGSGAQCIDEQLYRSYPPQTRVYKLDSYSWLDSPIWTVALGVARTVGSINRSPAQSITSSQHYTILRGNYDWDFWRQIEKILVDCFIYSL